MPAETRHPILATIGPGILLAATGVGAGDLLTAGLAGSEVGLALLWTVVAGGILKWTLSEGLARWQLASDTTLLEGWSWRIGGWSRWVFLVYLLLFTTSVGGALISACGVAGAGLLPVGDINTSKIVWGIAHSLAGLALVWRGSFALFEMVMSVCVGIMFLAVIGTGFLVAPDWSEVAAGFVPTIPTGQTGWVIAVLGGVGGTLTLLSYGYWIREAGRRGKESLKLCRIDLAVGNGLTALFGLAVIVIGSRVNLHGQGATMGIQFADQLAGAIGPAGRWIFLIGFWGAVFSSLLGVWQSVPYLFADFMDLARGVKPGVRRDLDLRKTKAYRRYLLAISTLPMVFLWSPVRLIQLAYGIVGAMFLPILALTLLIMNNQREWVGPDMRSGWAINLVLAIAVVFFGYVGGGELVEQVRGLDGG